jgi:protein-tyrosine phosphatase
MMIDLHCHMLPGIDDGAKDLDTALEMARIAVADGIRVTACTPHIYPGLYENTAAGIRRAVEQFRAHLGEAGIGLEITFGADIQIVPHLAYGLTSGQMPTLHASRYFLFEPPHHVAPPLMIDLVFNVLASGFVPVITHPERLVWIDEQYPMIAKAVRAGAWVQVTGGALTGRFGRGPRYWAEKLLDAGLVHILATDSHGPKYRPPLLAEAREAAVEWVGEAEAEQLVFARPFAILQNIAPSEIGLPCPDSFRIESSKREAKWPSRLARWFGSR